MTTLTVSTDYKERSGNLGAAQGHLWHVAQDSTTTSVGLKRMAAEASGLKILASVEEVPAPKMLPIMKAQNTSISIKRAAF